ncbi:MAG: hypothetical protein V3S02_00695 [Dehalococcoidales bacterium]
MSESDEVVALIDRLIEEHRIINLDLATLENVVNDAGAILNFEKAKDIFIPGRPGAKDDLESLDKLLDTIDKGLRAHFEREERGLQTAFDKLGTVEMAKGFHTLVQEHDALRDRLSEHEKIKNNLFKSLKRSDEPDHGTMTRQQWEATAHDMRAYILHSRKLVQEHTGREHGLFTGLRELLLAEAK